MIRNRKGRATGASDLGVALITAAALSTLGQCAFAEGFYSLSPIPPGRRPYFPLGMTYPRERRASVPMDMLRSY